MMKKHFKWQRFSKKQLKILTWWCDNSPVKDYDGIIADGAVRSGKTISMAPAFLNWSMEKFDGQDFAICGKTIGSLRRNVINTLKSQSLSLGYKVDERRTDNLLIVTKGSITNNYYMFGGKDESSQDLIQGMTLAGVFFDEVALMPQSFVTQAEARCSIEGAKYWYNCNPKNPTHWFKKEYVDLRKEKNLLYLHFTMDDNLTLSEKVKERFKRMFSGVFYQRNILGLWVTAEGKIYTTFTDKNIITQEDWYHKDEIGKYDHSLRKKLIHVTMGVDFGGNKSSTAFNLTGYTQGYRELITLKERRIKRELTPKELEKEFLVFVLECLKEYPMLTTVYCDSAEQVLIRGLKAVLRENRIPLSIENAVKGEIIDRIRFYLSMMEQLRYFIIDCCTETIEAYENAVWDEESDDDVRLDDGTSNIDNLDAQEYSSEKYQKIMIDVRM